MEVDTHNKDDNNIATLSPAPVDTLGKVNGDEELDFTITMNESEDEGSDDAVSSEPVKKANVNPAQVNGKLSSDDDSQASAPDSAKVAGKEKFKENDSEKEEGGGEKKKNLEKQHNGEKEDDADTEKKEAEHANSSDECKEEEDGAKNDVQADSKVSDMDTEKEKTTSKESGDDKSIGEDKEIKSDSEEKQGDGEEKKTESKDKKADDEDKKADSKGKVTPVKKAESALGKKPAEEDEDDDVVEIEDSPMKIDGGGGQQASFKFLTTTGSASRGSAGNLVLDARTGASVPFMTTAQGASLLPSSSGMQLMLPQGTPGVQGSAVMYVPNSGTFITTSSAAPFLSAINTAQQSQARSNASLLFSQNTNMMPNQANLFAMSSQQNQAARAGQPALAAALTNIPETPTSSKGMIDMIRWEVENHINIKPKYVRPNPKAELGNMAKWSFDLGSDLVKEYVYHDLVRIQHRRKDEGSLSDKEKEDFSKLQQIDKELNQKVGHLKNRLNKSCKCGFKTELDGVLYHHQQHAHIDRGGFLSCPLCKYSSRQPNTFRVHMEGEHGRVGKVENRPSFYECPLCPYETNFTNRLDQHKVRCQRQFRDAFNLHPSCITGPEVNLCLENVFYYVFTRQFMNSIIPKAATPAITSATKIRDMPAKAGTTVNSMLASKARGTAATQLVSARHIAPIMAAQKTTKQQLPNTLSRNFPVISSKINTITGQGVPSFVANQAAAIAKQAMASAQIPAPKQAPAPNQPNGNFEVCEICGGYVKDRKALRIHFFYAHRIDMPFGVFERPQPPLYCATCFARFWTAQGLQKHIEVHKNDMQSTTQTNNGVAGKCISCGHRVPNILMHMRMVHNRELRHYLAALMCIFCGNRFLTKKETENHMSKMHGVIVKNSSVQSSAPPPKPAAQTSARPGQQPPKASSTKQSPGPASSAKEAAAKPASGGKMNRSSQCVLCNLSFSRNVDLTRHCMRVHHTCMKCGLVVVDKESLSRHTCLHSASGMRTCEVCKESGFHPAYYIKHMRDKHLRKCTVVLRRIDRAVVESMKRPITISDSEDEEPLSGPSKSKQQKIYRGVKQVEEGKTKPTADGDHSDSKKQEEGKAETSSTEVGKEKGEDAEKGDDDKKEDANASKEEMSEDAEKGDEGKKEDPTEVEEEGEKDKHDSDVSEEKAAKEKGKETNSESDEKGKSNNTAPEESDSAEYVTKDQVPDDEEKEEGEKTAVSESENGVSHEDTDIKSGSLEKNAGRRCTRSRKSDAEMDSSEKQNSDNDKTVGDEKKPSSDKSQDPASPKKRKMDTSDSEDGSVRKSLRRSGSKGGDSMDLD
ncbi:MOG interacting and ectopic P-granules protein 1-like [Littorina saxatilis]|uniref:MOG interacting and ectopic P-granules protein 1-like n=1 Tax=Littorina saxatilis TaxID=31220 RepID=UPI0038B52E80